MFLSQTQAGERLIDRNQQPKMAHFHHCLLLLCPLFVIFFLHLPAWSVHGEVANGGHQDLPFLLSFKDYNPDNATALETWVGPNPCSGSWAGIRCSRGRVVGVFLDNASLVGSVTPLLGLTQIRVLAVRTNSLSGDLPRLDSSTSPSLRHLLVSHNKLTGSLNISLPSLVTLRAEHNRFHGGLQALRIPVVRKFNVSANRLAGEISRSLARFSSSSFTGNLALCGHPLPDCARASNVAVEDGASNASTTESPGAATNTSTGLNSSTSNGRFSELGLTAIVATAIGNGVLVMISLAISLAMFIYVRRKLRSSKGHDSDAALRFEEEDKVRNINGEEKCQKSGGLVCFEGGEELRLESLLKASAEVLGKGVSGSTYKAVLEDGIVAAVKRLSALQFPAGGRISKAFDRHVRLIGRLRHRHVVSLRGYCHSSGERLLVYDYLPGGSLQSLLRGGGKGSNLGWAARKRVLFGAAQGLDYIHTFPARPALAHGNVKPSNILVDERGEACVSECGLMRYAVQQPAAPGCPAELFLDRASSGAWHGYAAPELAAPGGGARATQESDVYSFGMVLLEVVTARGDGSGEEEECEGEETMGLVKIGMLCTAEALEERPRMAQVLAMMSEFM